MTDQWIIVRNWKEYQHPDVLRTKGPPAWIKLSTSIQHDQAFMELNWRRRAILLQLFVEYAMSHGRLTNNTRTLSQRLCGRVLNSDLESFVEAGFIELSASKPASKHASKPASPEKIREEKKPPYPLTGKTPNPNGRQRQPRPDEVPKMIDAVSACQLFIEGHSWDDSFDQKAIIEEFGRIERAGRTTGKIGSHELAGLIEQWKATRQDRYGTPANLGAAS